MGNRTRKTSPSFTAIIATVAAVALTTGLALSAHAQVQSDFSNGGGLRIGDSSTTCNSAIEGALRYNSSSGKTFSYCNGTAWTSVGGAGGTPAGSTTQIQFNSGGAFGASANLTWDNTASSLFINVTSTAGNAALESLRLRHEDSNSAGANGIGTYLSMVGESNSNGVFPEIGRVQAVMDDVANASKDSQLGFYTLGPDAGAGSNAATEKVRIDHRGNIGLNTTLAPSGTAIMFNGYSSAGNDTYFGTDSAFEIWHDKGNDMLVFAGTASGTAGTSWSQFNVGLSMTTDGKVGINNTAPNATLDIIGDIEYTGVTTDVSDRRLKENIVSLKESQSAIAALKPVSFTMKDDPKHSTELGFIAQDVQQVFPALVKTAPDEMGTMSLNYTGLIAPLVKAVQEQQQQIEALQQRINVLEEERKK